MRAPRILFLFNHDAAHQAAHIAGLAAAVARRGVAEVIIAYGTPTIRAVVEGLLSPGDAAKMQWVPLDLTPVLDTALAPLNRVAPVRRLARLDRHRALFEKCRKGCPGIEVAAALLGVGQRHQNLRRHHVPCPERLRPGLGESDLAHGGRRLFLLEPQIAARQAQGAAAERDSARGHDDDLGAPHPGVRQVIDQRGEP